LDPVTAASVVEGVTTITLVTVVGTGKGITEGFTILDTHSVVESSRSQDEIGQDPGRLFLITSEETGRVGVESETVRG